MTLRVFLSTPAMSWLRPGGAALPADLVKESKDRTLIIDVLARPQCEPAADGEIVGGAAKDEER
jgi:hypothetical protein